MNPAEPTTLKAMFRSIRAARVILPAVAACAGATASCTEAYSSCQTIGDGFGAAVWARRHENICILEPENEQVGRLLTALRNKDTPSKSRGALAGLPPLRLSQARSLPRSLTGSWPCSWSSPSRKSTLRTWW
jgi:hypothetical protein